jgi:NMD protein affecting ribosome stability and mRNA decay
MSDFEIDGEPVDDDEVVEVDSWHAGMCGACGMDELDAHEYSDGTIVVVCAVCGATSFDDGPGQS